MQLTRIMKIMYLLAEKIFFKLETLEKIEFLLQMRIAFWVLYKIKTTESTDSSLLH